MHASINLHSAGPLPSTGILPHPTLLSALPAPHTTCAVLSSKMAQFQGLPAPALISSSGGSTDVTGKAVLFYFSAHWCGPCRQFTPQLAEAYKTGVFASKNVEVVFVSADQDQSGFDGYFAEQPWLAVPFTDEAGREGLETKFGVSGYPSLVAVAADGTIMSKKARAFFGRDSTLATFPDGWTSPADVTACLAGAPLTNSTLASFDWSRDVATKSIIGLYFSAHWCPRCRAFTPQLVAWYNKMKAAGHSIELVFISSDRDQSQWMEYSSSMPWLSLNIWDAAGRAAKDKLEMLEGSVEHSGIPHLVLLKGEDLSDLLPFNAASRIRSDIDGYPWPLKQCESIEVALESINSKPIAMLIAIDANEAGCVAAMTEAAAPYCGDGAPPSAPLCTVLKASSDMLGRLSGFLGITSFTPTAAASLLVITNIPGGNKHVAKLAGVPSADDLTLAIAAFIAGSAPMVGLRDEAPASL